MATKKSTDVAVAASSEVTAFSQEVPDYIKTDTARGSEEVTSNDLTIPRLEIVQAQSTIKDEQDGVVDGHLYNSVTREILGDHAYFVPVYFRTEFLVWKDQDKGGGFFGSFPTMVEAKARVDEAVAAGENEEDIEIVDTPVHFGLLVTPDGSRCEQIVVSMAKSKAKVSRKWNSMIQIVGGDRFSRVYKLTTFKDENNNGQKFHNFVVQPAGFAPKAIYDKAEALYEVFRTTDVRAAHESVVENGAEAQPGTVRGNI